MDIAREQSPSSSNRPGSERNLLVRLPEKERKPVCCNILADSCDLWRIKERLRDSSTCEAVPKRSEGMSRVRRRSANSPTAADRMKRSEMQTADGSPEKTTYFPSHSLTDFFTAAALFWAVVPRIARTLSTVAFGSAFFSLP